jgi:ATP-dependent DNA helicase RecQ
VPAYVILHDSTLAELARRRPQTVAELATVSGIGARKLDRYGGALLGVLAS